MQRGFLTLGLAAALAAPAWAAAPPVKGAGPVSTEKIAWLNKTLLPTHEHAHAGRFEEAEELARRRLGLFQRVLGRDHWRTRDQRLNVERYQRLTKVPARRWQEVGRSVAL